MFKIWISLSACLRKHFKNSLCPSYLLNKNFFFPEHWLVFCWNDCENNFNHLVAPLQLGPQCTCEALAHTQWMQHCREWGRSIFFSLSLFSLPFFSTILIFSENEEILSCSCLHLLPAGATSASWNPLPTVSNSVLSVVFHSPLIINGQNKIISTSFLPLRQRWTGVHFWEGQSGI